MKTLLLGTRKGLLTFAREGDGWRFVREDFRAAPISYAAADPRDDTLWACLDHGHWGQKLHRSRDHGATWQEIATPAYPEGEKLRDNKPAVLSYLWIVAFGGADQPGRVYIGTEPGGLFRSDDGGDSFALVRSLWDRPERLEWWFGGGRDQAGLCSILVDPRDSRHLIIGISVGGVYESFDDGASWTPRNAGLEADFLPNTESEYGHDPHFITFSPANPDILWQQNHCGIFRSANGGSKSWMRVSQPPAYFGFPIAVDAHNPDIAWVVPAVSAEYRIAVEGALCVCRTDDGGASWKTFRAGLPQRTTYDVVFRHALDLDGDRLVFGTTTGNVYYSADRGESWATLGNNFPPVYSVRFCD
jgi:photosystem II stability/assembly factor-like uncharacterized protein